MLNKDDVLTYLRDSKKDFQQKYFIDKMGIFGSIARNEITENSDIDIVVTMKKPNLLNLSSIREEIKEHFKTDVDIVALWDKMNPRLYNRIQKESIYV